MKVHPFNIFFLTIFNCFREQLWRNSISPICCQNSDCHNVHNSPQFLACLIFLILISTTNSSTHYIFIVRKRRESRLIDESIVEILRVNNRKCHVIKNTELFLILCGKFAKLNFKCFELPLWDTYLLIIKHSVVGFGQLAFQRDVIWDFMLHNDLLSLAM